MKNIVLTFSLFKTIFFLLFLISIHKLVDTMDICESLDNIIGTVMKNPKTLKHVPDHLKTKKWVSIHLKNCFIYKICC